MSGPVAVARPPQPPRLRRESQRPGVARATTKQPSMEDDSVKPEEPRKYVYTQQDILAKHKGKPPSLRVYLHPKHFRLNDSQETLAYAGPMRELLLAIKDKVVPHNMVEDLYEFNTPWYDNCLIVEVHDFRSNSVKPKDESNSTGDGASSAFSIHNYNNFITPSPFAPHPVNKPESKPAQASAQSKEAEVKEDKENMPAPGQNGAANKQTGPGKVRTVVLFPTPQSQLADMQLLASTPVTDIAALKRMQAQGRAAGMPPTPMTAVPSTPTFSNGPSPKRQKMVLDDSNVHEFEAELLNATCPPLYLEPTKSFGHSLALMDAITHPINKNPAPPRKTRKRTTAELAADEAEAQGLQRFMLAGDEYQAVMMAAATGNDDNAVRAAANSQTFARFKTIANIRANHEETERRKKEEDARVAQAKRQAQMEAELQRKRELETRQQAELVERQQALRQQAAHQAQLQQQNQLQQNQIQQNEALRAAAAAQHQLSTATATQVASTPQSATQSQFSPTIRQQTPMAASAASPRVGGPASHPMGGTPMVPTASSQAINSPARPPSAVSHHQNQMARSVSQQQNPSRTGTPHMVQGTPVMNASMPNRNMTPTPSRMNQGSPPIAMQGQTPMMMQQASQPGQNMTPEMMPNFNQQRLYQVRMQQLQQQSASPGNPQQQQMQQLAFQKAAQHIQTQGVPQNQNPQQYRQQLAAHYFPDARAMNGMQNVNPNNPMHMQQYQQLLQQQRQQAANQSRLMQMRQQAALAGNQIPQGMMGNMNAMNNMQGGMQGMNVNNMGNMQGMNMAQMGQMNGGMGGMQGAQMNAGMQGVSMNQMSQQQMQQMMMMRQAQQNAQRMGQQGGQQGGDMGWSGV
ncbi:Spt20 domain containing protein [Pyrenophora tritici-repentis]|uniref:Membrane-bound metallopeptidase n=1 Tax=Pyrenophora tritici-repentis TaxID=45151 RepID=A0A317ABL4_9PLEO|nr:Spt20 domain-containing protein [Pyrenophora tritici-repentis]KAF7450111.1 Spt20 domain containing protein [Pyrenophora tritici-repentis]KAF7572682.1 Membrane-bound metallopeptidase [Pyrenophora tritici-repentis]KAG9376084.1 Spt20 domain containing protein [Pyrenophora tritici-repentis]KAI1586667.1 Spt20 multi-domain protein [Pyrenophora tritici-repentis]